MSFSYIGEKVTSPTGEEWIVSNIQDESSSPFSFGIMKKQKIIIHMYRFVRKGEEQVTEELSITMDEFMSKWDSHNGNAFARFQGNR